MQGGYTPGSEAGYPAPAGHPTSGTEIERPRVPGEPKTGFGPTPVSTMGIMQNAAFILVPTLLLTIESCIRFTQSSYSPTPGENAPWVSNLLAFFRPRC